EIRLGEPVRRLARVHGGFRVNDALEFSSVVITCAPQHAGQLLVQLPELADALTRIASFGYEPIVTCYLRYPDAVTLPAPMLRFTGGILQWVFDRGRIGGPPGLPPAGLNPFRGAPGPPTGTPPSPLSPPPPPPPPPP